MGKFKKTNFRSAIKKNVEKQKAAEGNYGYLRLPKDVRMYKEKEGKAYLDFIPYVVSIDNHPDKDGDVAAKGTLWYRMPFKVHRNIGSANDTVVCPTTFGKKCPICEQRAKLLSQGEKEAADGLRPSSRSLYVVIPLKDKTQKEEPHIWDVSDFLFQKLLNEELGDNEDYAAFPGLEDGLTLRIRFEGKTFEKNKYAQASRIDFLDREHTYDESILDDIPELEKVLIVLSYKELEMKFYDIDSDDTETDDVEDVEDVEVTFKRKKKVVTRQADDDDDDGDDDDDDEDKPIKKRKVKEVIEVDDGDDDDDDDEDDDEDEDVAPIRRKKVVGPVKPVRSRKVIEPAEDEDDDEEEDITPTKKRKVKEVVEDTNDDDDEDEIDIPLKDRCIACGGTGYNSKGGICKACMGTGRKPKAEAVTSKAMQEEVKASKPTIEKAGKRKPSKDSCPFDHTFGECDKHDDCLKCPSDIWDKCMDAAEEAE